MSLFKDIFYLFQRPPHCFGVHEENLNKGGEIEGTEDEVGFPGDGVEPWWDGECESGVECPIGCLNTKKKLLVRMVMM